MISEVTFTVGLVSLESCLGRPCNEQEVSVRKIKYE
jgi:hypothetical protein